jgi:hypothetical protein
VFYSAFNGNGANWRIGKMYLAMSQPGATGSSTTGVYTNTNPQVNLGFKSTDSVVLFYDRKAEQTVTSAATGDLDVKTGFVSKTGTNTGDSFLLDIAPFYAPGPRDWQKYKSNDVDVTVGLDKVNFSEYNDQTNALFFDPKEYLPHTLFRGVALTFHTDGESGARCFDGYVSLVSKSSWLSETITLGGQKVGTLSVFKQTDGRFRFFVNLDSDSSYPRAIACHIANVGALLDMIGRPLVK